MRFNKIQKIHMGDPTHRSDLKLRQVHEAILIIDTILFPNTHTLYLLPHA